jgi:hypothetical protein
MKHDGRIMAQVSPENLNVTWNKGETGPHEVTFEVPDAYPGFDIATIQPYNNDFALILDDVPIMKGIITSCAFESEENYASVAGKDWLHYLERRFYPFDPLNPNYFRVGNPPRGLAYETPETDEAGIPTGPEADITDIVEILLSQTLSVPNSLPIVWTGQVLNGGPFLPTPPDGLQYMVVSSSPYGSWWSDYPYEQSLLPRTGTQIPYSISLGDTESILSKIQQLSQQAPGIFDFWIDQNKVFHMAVPRQYSIDVLADATLAHWVFRDSDSGLLKVNWTNNGPLGTHLFGHASSNVYYGTGTDETVESVNLGLNMEDPVNQNVYRRLDAEEDFGDVPNRYVIDNLTRGYFPRTDNPSFELSLEIVADAVPDLFKGRIYPGCAIWVDYTHPLYHVNSAWEVVSMELQVSTETEENVTLNCNQIFPNYEEPAPPYIPSGVVPFPPVSPVDPVHLSRPGGTQIFAE